MAERVAVFAGTFDPVTNGHLDLIRRAAPLFDRLVIGVSRKGKGTLFTWEERVALLRDVLAPLGNVTAEPFEGLLVEFARRRGAHVLLRGGRTYQDWEYELGMVQMNRHLSGGLETLFLAPSPACAFISSSLVRETAALGADVSALVPAAVLAALVVKAAQRGR